MIGSGILSMLQILSLLVCADQAASDLAVQNQKNSVAQAVNDNKAQADCAATCQNSSTFDTCKQTCLTNTQATADAAKKNSTEGTTNSTTPIATVNIPNVGNANSVMILNIVGLYLW